MLGADELADVEGDAEFLRRTNGCTEETSIVGLCRAETGHAPIFVALGCESKLDAGRVLLRRGTSLARARWLTGHELAEKHYGRIGYRGSDIEERCDALGAALVAPWATFRAAMRHHGHAVYKLAELFGVTQSLALLRVGEVSGRPVTLLRWPEPIARGGPYEWPSTSTLVRCLRERREGIHPLRITDERGKWGLMSSV